MTNLSDELWLRLQFLKHWMTPYLCYALLLSVFPAMVVLPPLIMILWWSVDLLLTGRTARIRMIRAFDSESEQMAWFMVFMSGIFVPMFVIPIAFETSVECESHPFRFAGLITGTHFLISGFVVVKRNIYNVFLATHSSSLLQRRDQRRQQKIEQQQQKIEQRQQLLATREVVRRERRAEAMRRAEELRNRTDRRFARMSAEFERRLNAIRQMPVPEDEKTGLVEEAQTQYLNDVHGLLGRRLD